ncbi:M1 family metallopeptidase [Flavobacterium okayamense]|uniref:Aminopeptidase N n=1 Tax=Flavobacterium okayamense TaxID=2830782 RepID=A0ABM7S6U1_9FLAO|nr:M1 family metallopeptidase [Flavobacterium okayamense]BCY29233.1 aminopeptidase [Flavobacterium okayamense]
MLRYFFLFFSVLAFSQQYKSVDFIRCYAYVNPIFEEKSISGAIEYEFNIYKKIDTISIDAVAMEIRDVKINNKKVPFVNDGKHLKLYKGFKKKKNIISFTYSAKPKQALYFTGKDENLQIWTQGQGKYTSHWLPSFDDVNEKVIFDININFNSDYEVLSNGIISSPLVSDGSETIWSFSMKKPMSSYLLMLAIGKFSYTSDRTTSNTFLEYYLDRKDSLKFEPTYRHSKQIFEFLEQEIGIEYPWEVYRQVPVRDFLYAGMENTTSTIFSQDFVVDSIGYNDKNYLNVNAHELAHQWFGDLVTAKESKHHWLQEGFATYYALLAEQSVFGDDYFYHQLWEMATQLERASAEDTEPILSEKASSLTFYKKGAWALHVLREEVGEENFKKAVKNYLEKYQYKNVDTDEFLAEIKKVAPNFDIQTYKKNWLETPGFDFQGVQKYLTNASFIQTFYEVINSYQISFADKKNRFEEIMQSDIYFPVKKEILYQCEVIPFEEKRELIELAMATNNFEVRQAVAQTVNTIQDDFREQFESLLQDNSYITKEIALFKLWKNFKEDQYYYTQLSNGWEGLNYNLKIANLTLKIVTKGISPSDKIEAITELEKMTQLPYESGVRQAAIETLLSLQIPSEQVLISILESTLYHKWQFVKFGKDKIRRMLSNAQDRERFKALQPKLSEELQARLQTFLKETE